MYIVRHKTKPSWLVG